MKRLKYLTQEEVRKISKYFLAASGSCFAPVKKIYGTITTNEYGKKYNTSDVSIMVYTENFWDYWEQRAKRENVYFELYADQKI